MIEASDKRRHKKLANEEFYGGETKKKDAFLPLLMHAPNPSSKSKLQLSQGQDGCEKGQLHSRQH